MATIDFISDEKIILCKEDRNEIDNELMRETAEKNYSAYPTIEANSPEDEIESIVVNESTTSPKAVLRFNAVNNTGRDDAPYCLRNGPWDDASSKILIRLIAKYPSAYFFLDKESTRITHWQVIRQELEDHGYKFSLFQVRMHWRSLMKVYKKTVDSNELNGTQKECQYFKEMTECLGKFDRQATLCLIKQVVDQCKGRVNKSGCLKLRTRAWINIAKGMQAFGYRYYPFQVQARWRVLIQLYQLAVRHNTKHPDDIIKTAYHDELADVYDYIPLLCDKPNLDDPDSAPSRQHHSTFSLKDERVLLGIYEKHMHKFMRSGQYAVWCEIYKEFISITDLNVKLQQIRNCFYEIKRRLVQVKQHNSNPGAIHKTARHSEILERIYSTYDCWPHNKRKMNTLTKIKNRQYTTQMMWTEEETSALLSLYPEVLVDYQSSREPLPYIKLSQHLADKLVENGHHKRPALEIETLMQQLRKGYEKLNLHPFNNQFRKILILEEQLGFKAPVSEVKLLDDEGTSAQTSPQTELQYWGQEATLILLKTVTDHYKGSSGLHKCFAKVQKKLAEANYNYTVMDCMEYFEHLKRIYQCGIRYLSCKRRISRPFVYAQEMQELFQVMNETSSKLPQPFINKKQKRVNSPSVGVPDPKRSRVDEKEEFEGEWSLEANQLLLACVRNTQNVCLTWTDFVKTLEIYSALWPDVLHMLKLNGFTTPSDTCAQFQEIIREYSQYSYSALVTKEPNAQPYIDEIEDLVLTFSTHDADPDPRDLSWDITEHESEFPGWAREEILELIFILSELNHQEGLSPDPGMWLQVSSMLMASHRHFFPLSCQEVFSNIFKQCLLFWQRDLYCKKQNKTYPSFYFKVFNLFETFENCPFILKLIDLPPRENSIPRGTLLIHDELYLKWLAGLRGEKCHPVPRLKLLEKMVCMHYKHFGEEVEPSGIWNRLVNLHFEYLNSLDSEDADAFEHKDLMEAVWSHHENPLHAYNFIAYNLPLWQIICHWTSDVIERFFSECASLAIEASAAAPENASEEADFITSLTERLHQKGHTFSHSEVTLTVNHFLRAFLHGGYKRWKKYLSLIIILQPSLTEKTPLKGVVEINRQKFVVPPFCGASEGISTKSNDDLLLKGAAHALVKYGNQCTKENRHLVNLCKEMHQQEMTVLSKLNSFLLKFEESL